MITFRQQGDFSRLTRFLERAKEAVKLGDLDKYGQAGVAKDGQPNMMWEDFLTREQAAQLLYRFARKYGLA